MRSVADREANILRRFKVTPISPLPILVAAMASGWLLYLPVPILLVALAHFLYAMPLPHNWISLFVMVKSDSSLGMGTCESAPTAAQSPTAMTHA